MLPYRKLTAAWLAVALTAFAGACQSQSGSASDTTKTNMSTKSYAGTQPATDFPAGMKFLNTAHPISLKEMKGKIVLLDFWTYCCINCMHVIPDLKKLEKEFPELVVIGVHSAKFQNEKDADNIRQAILRYDIAHPVAVDGDFYMWRIYGIQSWPSFALIDPAGNLVGTTSGEGVYAQLKPVISGLSQEFDVKGQLNKTPLHFVLEREKRAAGLLAYPGKIKADAASHRLFFTDANHNRIIIATPEWDVQQIIGSGASGQADGGFAEASFYRPQGLAYDAVRDVLFVADTDNHLIREVNLRTKTVKTVLGTGHQNTAYPYPKTVNGTSGALNSPWDLQLLNGKLYITMAGPHQLWVMDPGTYHAEVYAGTGQENLLDAPRLQANLAQPSGITTDGRVMYFADSEVSALREVVDDAVRTLIGEGLFEFGDIDGTYPTARLQHCIGVFYHDGVIYIADTYNHKIRKYNLKTRRLTTLIGTGRHGSKDGPALQAELFEPNDITFLDSRFYITDTNNDLIRIYDPATGLVSTLKLKDTGKLSMLAKKNELPATQATEVPFYGETVKMPAQTLSANSTAHVHITVPAKYHINPDAPNYISVIGQTGTASAIQANGPSFTTSLPLQLTTGTTTLRLEAGVYFCEDGRDARCLIKQLRFEIPVTVNASGAKELALNYTLPEQK